MTATAPPGSLYMAAGQRRIQSGNESDGGWAAAEPSPIAPSAAGPSAGSAAGLTAHQRSERFPVRHVHLDAGPVEVALHGADRDGQAVGDLPVGQPCRNEIRDFAFARGER